MNRRWLRLLLLAALSAAPAGAYAAEALEDPLRLLPQEIGTREGEFVIPNEFHPHLWEDSLKGKDGALISVGTFRALHDAALGDFSRVVMLDYDGGACRFNRAHLELIRGSADRWEYLARLLQRTLPPDLLEAARSGRVGDKELFASLTRLPPTGAPAVPFIAEDAKKARHRLELLEQAIARFQDTPEQWRGTFFGSDARFEKVKRLVSEGRISVLAGNLAGKTTLRELSALLRRQGIAVSALDISNAMDFFPRKDDTKRFWQNLQELPFAEDAVLLATGFHPHEVIKLIKLCGAKDLRRRHDGWRYWAVPAKEINAVAKERYLSPKRREGLLERISGAFLDP